MLYLYRTCALGPVRSPIKCWAGLLLVAQFCTGMATAADPSASPVASELHYDVVVCGGSAALAAAYRCRRGGPRSAARADRLDWRAVYRLGGAGRGRGVASHG